MAFFHNRDVNLINLHSAIAAVAMGGGGAFWSVYLLKAGVSVPGVLLTLAATFLFRLLLRSFLLPLAVRFGVRITLIIGTVLFGASFPFVLGVHGIGAGLYLMVVAVALADTVYWPSYHAYFAAVGDEEHRGQQTSLREAVSALLGIAAPLIAAWSLTTYGPHTTFWVTGAIEAAAAIPLLWGRDVPVAKDAPGAIRHALKGAILFVGDGVVAAGYFITWQIALFLTLDQSYLAYGGALAIASLVGAVSGLALGRLIDAGRGGQIIWLAVGLIDATIALRAAAGHHPALAVAANALGALNGCIYVPTMMTAVYNSAKRAPCVMRFNIVAEGGWDVGVTLGLCITAGLVWLGVPINATILVSLLGTSVVFVLLRRYYAAHAAERVDASRTQSEESVKI
jgi:hypothetical protein